MYLPLFLLALVGLIEVRSECGPSDPRSCACTGNDQTVCSDLANLALEQSGVTTSVAFVCSSSGDEAGYCTVGCGDQTVTLPLGAGTATIPGSLICPALASQVGVASADLECDSTSTKCIFTQIPFDCASGDVVNCESLKTGILAPLVANGADIVCNEATGACTASCTDDTGGVGICSGQASLSGSASMVCDPTALMCVAGVIDPADAPCALNPEDPIGSIFSCKCAGDADKCIPLDIALTPALGAVGLTGERIKCDDTVGLCSVTCTQGAQGSCDIVGAFVPGVTATCNAPNCELIITPPDCTTPENFAANCGCTGASTISCDLVVAGTDAVLGGALGIECSSSGEEAGYCSADCTPRTIDGTDYATGDLICAEEATFLQLPTDYFVCDSDSRCAIAPEYTNAPSMMPSKSPSMMPSKMPTAMPSTMMPSTMPSKMPTAMPTATPDVDSTGDDHAGSAAAGKSYLGAIAVVMGVLSIYY